MSESRPQLVISANPDGWSISGEVDSHTAPDLAAAMATLPGTSDIVADVGGVSFMDSSGLRVLVDASMRAGKAGSSLILLNPQPSLRRVVEISGLADHLPMRD